MTTLTAVPALAPQQSVDAASREAWTIIGDGYRSALKVDGLSEDDRATIVRQARRCDALAGRDPLGVAGGDA